MTSDFYFVCSKHGCICTRRGMGLYFTTDSLEEGERHSRENNSPMWIVRKGDVERPIALY